jgi:hypothetical protein
LERAQQPLERREPPTQRPGRDLQLQVGDGEVARLGL